MTRPLFLVKLKKKDILYNKKNSRIQQRRSGDLHIFQFFNVDLLKYCYCVKWVPEETNEFLLKFLVTPKNGPFPPFLG